MRAQSKSSSLKLWIRSALKMNPNKAMPIGFPLRSTLNSRISPYYLPKAFNCPSSPAFRGIWTGLQIPTALNRIFILAHIWSTFYYGCPRTCMLMYVWLQKTRVGQVLPNPITTSTSILILPYATLIQETVLALHTIRSRASSCGKIWAKDSISQVH